MEEIHLKCEREISKFAEEERGLWQWDCSTV